MQESKMFKTVRAAVVLLVSAVVIPSAVAEGRPNVVLMMADDLGYNDLSCYGSTRIRTPHLDSLARDGIRLTSFYSGSTVCTPSRMALMTGAYPTRLGWPGGVVGYRIPGNRGLAPQALTMGEVFQNAGYATGICGKWHLGDSPSLLPMNQGFESAFYIKRSNNQTKKLWRGDKLVANPFDNRRLTEQFTREAISFIRQHRSKPFFLYIPFTAPHFPAQAHPDWKGRSSNDAYGDVVEELDSRVGEILQTLKEKEIAHRTIVVFLSDNGPEPGQRKWASAKPLRGLKWSSLEGGTRVPCIVRWPGVIPENRGSDKLIAAIDLLPTLANACGIELKPNSNAAPKMDGLNVWDTLIQKKNSQHARTNLLYWDGWAKLEAIRFGEWKLYLGQVKGVAGSAEGPVLFHLGNDPGETKNLAARHAEKVKDMTRLSAQLTADIKMNAIPLGDSQASP
jgi:arylsulfatase A